MEDVGWWWPVAVAGATVPIFTVVGVIAYQQLVLPSSQLQFEVIDRKCVCDGLKLTLEMAEFYRKYAKGVKRIPSTPETKEKALRIVKKFLETIKPEDAYGSMGREWLQRARSEAIACERERDGCMMALEWLRAAIHEDPGLQAKLTCQKWKPGLGVEFVERQPYNAIRWAMYGLAGFGTLTEEDAVKTLKETLKNYSCLYPRRGTLYL